MSGLLRGALNLIQGESSTSTAHPLIGTYVDVGKIRLRVNSIIAEGGFAIVFAAYDNSNKWYALKRQLAQGEDSMEAVLREIRILKELSGHPAVLRFIAAAQMKLPSAGVEFMLLTELCSGGSVADLLKTTRVTTGQALKIFHSASMAVCHMHERRTPITHRDIKVIEFYLLSEREFAFLRPVVPISSKISRPIRFFDVIFCHSQCFERSLITHSKHF
ncbi:hypothetical protein KIN20_011142 [Parelaphostrongylus tenuis]|uniref:Protein kinase domain-containing protein n=1 Tax=Parelaphostrongylus tenuis TaxID=148309 RepID=A0AAD5QPN1_PARTN|nr:hypothetical protein KIN20_011142 [Parelaphostrongylus tenuis]